MARLCSPLALTTNVIAATGLKEDGTSISQIPSYVTGVPDGTESVSNLTHTQASLRGY
jgi:hypothetical protein